MLLLPSTELKSFLTASTRRQMDIEHPGCILASCEGAVLPHHSTPRYLAGNYIEVAAATARTPGHP